MAEKIRVECPICDWHRKFDERDAKLALGRHVTKRHSRSSAPVTFSDGAGGGRRIEPRPTLEDHDRRDK